MAKTKISEFSSTPGNNTEIDNINISEGCAPSGINDAIRELMAQLKDFQAGTAGDSFNGPVGTTTAAAGAFTTLTASSTATLNTLASSGATLTGGTINGMAIGGTTAAAVSATTLTTSSTVTHNGGTANGVAYLNGSKVLTSGSALTFDGTNLGVGTATPTFAAGTGLQVKGAGFTSVRVTGGALTGTDLSQDASGGYLYVRDNLPLMFGVNNTEQMRLTSTGLGIGTSSPAYKLDARLSGTSSGAVIQVGNTGSGGFGGLGVSDGGAYPVQMWGAALTFLTGSSTYGSATERMRINSSGNVGIGTDSPTVRLQVSSATASQIYATDTTSGNTAQMFASSAGAVFGSFTNADVQIRTNNTERLRITSTGNVGIGTSSPYRPLQVKTSDGATALVLSPTSTTTGTVVRLDAANEAGSGFSTLHLRAYETMFHAGGSERMRLDSSGNLLVGTTSATSRTGATAKTVSYANSQDAIYATNNDNSNFALCSHIRTTSGTRYHIGFGDGTSWAERGTISTDGTSTSYNTSSDYRLKNITGPLTTSGAYIDSLNPVEGTWKADGSTFVGLIAHEVQEASRTTVATGVKDGERMQGMDYSSAEIIANLIAEVKSLRQRLAALEAA